MKTKPDIHQNLKKLPNELKDMWDQIEPNPDPVMPDEHETEAALKKVWAAIDEQPVTEKRTSFVYWAAASAVLFMLGIGSVLTFERTYTTSSGEQNSQVLPDGSRITLNGNSSLSYRPVLFNYMHRKVQLEGEARFDVVPSTKAFVVNTEATSVTVLGTQFTVSDWSDNTSLSPVVRVFEGNVRVNTAEDEQNLLAGDGVLLDPVQNRLTPFEHDQDPDTPFSFSRLGSQTITLSYLFDRLSALHGVDIEFDRGLFDDERIKAYYTSEKSLTDILSDVSSLKDLSVNRTKTGYTISR
ncbi:MAG: FecR domain-containing protein [Bacteroidota bacterium]